MSDIPAVAPEENQPTTQDDLQQTGNGAPVYNRVPKRSRVSGGEDDDDDEDKPGRERRKIEIKFIQDKSRRHITFSKRKAGIMKKVCRVLTVMFFFSNNCVDFHARITMLTTLRHRRTSCPS